MNSHVSGMQSLRAFTKALKLNPNNHDAAGRMADVLENMNKVPDAIEW
jgi:cytochrome c-type biogenesis protein CcmH/NrfG